MPSSRLILPIFCLFILFSACGSKNNTSGVENPKPQSNTPEPEPDSVPEKVYGIDTMDTNTEPGFPPTLYDAWRDLIADSDFNAPKGFDYGLNGFLEYDDFVIVPVDMYNGGRSEAYTWLTVDLRKREILDIGLAGEQSERVNFDAARMDTVIRRMRIDASEWECESKAREAAGASDSIPDAGTLAPEETVPTLRRFADVRECNFPYEWKTIFSHSDLDEASAWRLLRLLMNKEESEAAPVALPVKNTEESAGDFFMQLRTLPGQAHWLEFAYPGGVTTFALLRTRGGTWMGWQHGSAD